MQLQKIFILFIASTLCLSILTYGQAVQTKEPNYRDPVLDRQFGILAEVKAKPAGVEGTYYLNDQWNSGNIILKSGDTLRGYPLKYDIERDLLEIKTQQEIKILAGNKIAMFEWENQEKASRSLFVNGSFYTYEDTKLIGFYEVLSTGKAQLLSRTFLEKMKANYNVALDIGSRSEKFLKKEKFYISRDQHAYEISSKKEKISTAFGNYTDRIISFARANRLKFNNRQDLINIVKYYNSLN